MNENEPKTFNLLVAEDDKDDFYLIQKAFQEHCPEINLIWLKDGEELTDYLTKGQHRSLGGKYFPILLLDLNLPKKDGRQALEEIKNDPVLCVIPVVVFTTSNAPEDLRKVYRLGAAAYVMKPNGFPEYINFAKSFKNWLERITLPVLEEV